ncbi:MAG TPA: hypothetical protein VIV11_18900 [Kofleriaceae bacterium]
MRWVPLLLVSIAGTAAADPAAKPQPPSKPATAPPSAPAPTTVNDPQPLTRAPTVAPFLVFDPPPPPVKSLRIEALRIAGERSEADWRFPEPEPIMGFRSDGSFFMGYPQHRPRNARSAALHTGAAASTLLGEILLGTGAPIAGVGAMLTGATLDAAAADVDRDAEARRKQ